MWSPSPHAVAFSLADRDESAGGGEILPVCVKLVISAAVPLAVSHNVSFVGRLCWKTAMLRGGF